MPVLDGLISMCRDLGTEIVAEGVETEAQALYLRARGVVMAQGFLFAPALKVGRVQGTGPGAQWRPEGHSAGRLGRERVTADAPPEPDIRASLS